MHRTALALSPHLDDAIFSCAGTLARLADGGWRVVVATLFTATVPDPRGFALACQLDKGLGPEVDYMALRRAEDAEACRLIGAEAVWLPFREAPHRGYASAPELFGPLRTDDRIGRDLGLAIRELVIGHAPDLILAPQAVGGHVDHIQVVTALGEADIPGPIAWWRDWPYASRSAPAEPFADRMAALREIPVELNPDALRRKREACRAYPSQLGFQFGGPAGLDRRLAEAGTTERFRANRRTAAMLPGKIEGAA